MQSLTSYIVSGRGLKAGNGMVEADSIGNLTLRPFINRKLKELVMTSLKISVWRKLKEAEIQNLKESCLGEFGGNCKDADEISLVKTSLSAGTGSRSSSKAYAIG